MTTTAAPTAPSERAMELARPISCLHKGCRPTMREMHYPSCHDLTRAIALAIDSAVGEERERCEKAVAEVWRRWPRRWKGVELACRAITEAITGAPPPKGEPGEGGSRG